VIAKLLQAAVTKQRACLEAGDLVGFSIFDQEFHKVMYEAAKLMSLWHMIGSASGNLDRLRRLHLPLTGKAQSVLEQHAGIAAAIAEGDTAGAQAWVRKHLSGTLAGLDNLANATPTTCSPCLTFVDSVPADSPARAAASRSRRHHAGGPT
jgi:DNA-binding GntR family transcriptional regulator